LNKFNPFSLGEDTVTLLGCILFDENETVADGFFIAKVSMYGQTTFKDMEESAHRLLAQMQRKHPERTYKVMLLGADAMASIRDALLKIDTETGRSLN